MNCLLARRAQATRDGEIKLDLMGLSQDGGHLNVTHMTEESPVSGFFSYSKMSPRFLSRFDKVLGQMTEKSIIIMIFAQSFHL